MPPTVYHVYYNNESHGPYFLEQIRAMWDAGIITADAQYCTADSGEWKPILDLFTMPAPAVPPPIPRQTVPPIPAARRAASRRYLIWFAGAAALVLCAASVPALKFVIQLRRRAQDDPKTAKVLAAWQQSQNVFETPVASDAGNSAPVAAAATASPTPDADISGSPTPARKPAPKTENDDIVARDNDYIAARSAESKPDFTAMLEHAQALVKRHPRSVLAYKCLTNAFYFNEDARSALKAANTAVELGPEDVMAHYLLGKIDMTLNLYPEAGAAFKEALRLGPDEVLPWTGMAWWLFVNKKNSEALQHLDRATEILKSTPFYSPYDEIHEQRIWDNIGTFYTQMDQQLSAINAFEHATNLSPEDAFAWSGLGHARYQMKFYEKAAIALEKALKLHPSDIRACRDLGLTYHDLKRYADAADVFKRLTARTPDDPLAWYWLGSSCYYLDRNADAITALERSAKLNPKDSYTCELLGFAYEHAGRTMDAIKSFRATTQLSPDALPAWMGLGRTYDKAGRIIEAIAAYRKALELKPGYQKAQDALDHDLAASKGR